MKSFILSQNAATRLLLAILSFMIEANEESGYPLFLELFIPTTNKEEI